jgi:hypothetical protein
MYSDNKLRVIFGAGTLAVISAALGGLSLLHQPMAPDGEAVLGSPVLVMFETEDCGWCPNFRRNTAKAYLGSEFADGTPLRYLSADNGPPPKKYRMASFRQRPMLVMFDQYGRELDRIESEPASSQPIEAMVRKNLRRIAKTS